mmetsp:Transcript_5966/g.4506  ORF Transcript_5966/g.4506 Transcript_5966/m.4506 type:complete len:133 (-) Transcript_5966:32-430(-)
MQLNKILEEKRKQTKDIVADMTRQFKSMQEELTLRITDLESQSVQNNDTIKYLKSEFERGTQEKNDIENQKNEEIQMLKNRIDEMSSTFAEMLKETLQKMQQRIEQANEQWENENEHALLKRFEEAALGGNK